MKPYALKYTFASLSVFFFAVPAISMQVCHGYDCTYKTRIELTSPDWQRITSAFKRAAASPANERKAIAQAIQVFEERSTRVIGVRDKPKMQFGQSRIRGQMDCVDESLNTDMLIRALAARSLLRHHRPATRTSRGIFLDGRYPHWTAVIVDPGKTAWAVDSWYEAGGKPPRILPLSQWKQQGFNESN